MSLPKLNLPNKLTIMRILLVPVFVVLLFVDFKWHTLSAMIVYSAACITDFFDGMIARKQHLVTNMGKFLDPIADKIIVACALIGICAMEPLATPARAFSICTLVFTMVIISREFIISGFRIIAAKNGIVLAADWFGKIKTAMQMIAIGGLLLAVDIYAYADTTAGLVFYYIGFSLLAGATLMAIISAINYLVKNKAVLED